MLFIRCTNLEIAEPLACIGGTTVENHCSKVLWRCECERPL